MSLMLHILNSQITHIHVHIVCLYFRKAVKATVILFPLLGITYVLFIMPPSDHRKVQVTFKYINAVLQSFQVSYGHTNYKESTRSFYSLNRMHFDVVFCMLSSLASKTINYCYI